MAIGAKAGERNEGDHVATWGAAAGAAAILFLALALPNHPAAATPSALAVLPLELPVIAALLLGAGALGCRAAFLTRVLVTVFLGGTAILKLADQGLFSALNRPFNLAYDMPLLHAGWMLLRGSSGAAAAVLYIALALVGVALLLALIWWATGAVAAAGRRVPRPATAAAAVLAGMAALGMAGGIGSGETTRIAHSHMDAVAQAAQDIAALEAEAADDPADRLPRRAVLASLDGRDVILAFVESYGRATHDNPLYAATTREALADVAADLDARGLAMRSAWLTSPVVGGQSWLAHATLLSGLWINSHGRYRALLTGSRSTLLTLAASAGWRTVGVMPAITMPWPEGTWFQYAGLYAAADLGYRGLPFNWVTMPDQYTLAAFERFELAPAERPPVFAELALISSHAPWTPVASLVPWDDVGDGSIFDAQATSGEAPETVWRDQDSIRDHYRMTIDYALRTVGSFAARRAEAASREASPLFIVLGDHQPPVFVSGTPEVHEVPVHIIGDPETLSRLDGWGWTEGLRPAADAPVWRMDRFRDRFLDAFSAPEEPEADGEAQPS